MLDATVDDEPIDLTDQKTAHVSRFRVPQPVVGRTQTISSA